MGGSNLTCKVCHVTEKPDEQEAHGQAVGALGSIVCYELRQLVEGVGLADHAGNIIHLGDYLPVDISTP